MSERSPEADIELSAECSRGTPARLPCYWIYIDAPINQGNSGGPSFNLDGQVVGVTTAIYSVSGGSVGIGFAIPAETARSVIADLKSTVPVLRLFVDVAEAGRAGSKRGLLIESQFNSRA